jgi:hypothetical protein
MDHEDCRRLVDVRTAEQALDEEVQTLGSGLAFCPFYSCTPRGNPGESAKGKT